MNTFNKKIWLKAVAIVILQGFVLSNIASLPSYPHLSALHMRKQSSASYTEQAESSKSIQKLGEDEISVSKKYLQKYLVGTSKDLMNKFQKNFKLPNPRNYKKNGFICGDGENSVIFLKRISWRQTVWTFKADDLEKVAKILDIEVKKEIPIFAEDELSISQSLGRTFIVGGWALMAGRVKDNLNLPEVNDFKENEIIRGEGRNKIIFFRRKRKGGQKVWAFKADDLEKFADILGLKIKQKMPALGKDELSITWATVRNYLICDQNVMLQRIKDLKLPDIYNFKDDEVSQGKGKEKVTFFKRKNGNYTVWAFKYEDLENVAKLLEVKMKKEFRPLGENEVALSGHSLSNYFIGGNIKLLKLINDKIALPDVNTAIDKEITFGKNYKITFFKRMANRSKVWAFKVDDIENITEILGIELKKELPIFAEDEIAVNISLSKHLIGSYNYSIKKRIKTNLSLPEIDNSKENEIIRGEDKNKVTFFKRKRKAGQKVWAFKAEDLEKVADILGLKMKDRLDMPDTSIEDLDIAEAIALLGDDPLRLQQYIRIYHPELSSEEVDRIIVASLHGLRPEWQERAEELHSDYAESLDWPVLGSLPEDTDAESFAIEGYVVGDISYLQLTGAYNRKINVMPDGSFSARIPLPKIGEVNEFWIYGVNPRTEQKSRRVYIRIRQTGEKQDIEETFLQLLSLKQEVLENIRRNPQRYNFMLRCVEQSLLKHFTYDENQGFKYLQQRIKEERSPVQRSILRAVLTKFEKIRGMNFNLKSGERLYFFQKYCIDVIRSSMKEGAGGIILANEQGLGKTVTALASINGEQALIIAPNSVVTTWAEQEEQFFPTANLEILEGPYSEREETLESNTRPQIITNVEYTQGMTERRKELLSNYSRSILIVDEGDYLGKTRTQQSEGTAALEAGFKLLLTATPFRRPSQIMHLLRFLEPDDPRFGSAKTFARAFPTDSPEALNALFLLLQQYTIRLRKRDLFQEYDPNILLEKQDGCLPKKIEISPEEDGYFHLTQEQSESILQLYTDYQAWCRRHKGNESDEDREYYRYKEGYFSKKEALRQIMNSLSYIGISGRESPKHKKMDELIEYELTKDPERKILIFCRYTAQVEEYLRRYRKYGARAYYGGLRANSNKYKIDENGNLLYYKVDEYENFGLDNKNRFIPADKSSGRPIKALDYERLLFQNDPESRIMIANYATGAVGVTFTAADAVIYDDIAPTYRDQYQAGDRAHRIDNRRKKYDVTYYWLQARYPELFLRNLSEEERRYFSMGTYDQVHLQNLNRQKRIFHRIIDGVGSQAELEEINRRFMKERMPFLFRNNEEDVNNSVDSPTKAHPIRHNPPSPMLAQSI